MKNNREILVALAGNPNSGKTSIFNALTGARQKVGNFPGVTVEKRTGQVYSEPYNIIVVDLPGTYSLTAQSLDEKVARDFLLKESPDLVINVIDGGCLERSLYLTTQLIAMGLDVVIDINMWDELVKSGQNMDTEKLSVLLGAPVVTTVASKGEGVQKLLQAVIDLYENKHTIHHHPPVSYGSQLDDIIIEVAAAIDKSGITPVNSNSRWIAVKLLEDDVEIKKQYGTEIDKHPQLKDKIAHGQKHIKATISLDPYLAFEEGRLGYVAGIVREVVKKKTVNRMQLSTQIDNYFTHPFLGYPLFLLIMWLIFYATFAIGQAPMNAIEQAIGWLQNLMDSALPPGAWRDLIVHGIIGGVGAVIVFLPNIVILFFGISLLEDSGYMARAAFITDRPMHFLGLHGKSFIPMLMGFGCTVPAIMATRTLESHRDRVVTTLLLPMVSCSAKLPVYILIAGAFFGAYAGRVVFSLYILGIVIAIIVARIYRRTLFKKESMPFVMELPPYRWPTAKSLFIHIWERTKIYLRKMGGVILVASVILWALGYFPRNIHYARNYEMEIQLWQNSTDPQAPEHIKTLQRQMVYEDLEHSYIGQIGQVLEPVFKPLGFNWQMSVSLLTGFAAKEVVVSTLGVLYQIGDDTEDDTVSLAAKLRADGITSLSAYSFLVFILLYTACVATVLAMKREIGVRWMLFSIVFQTALAWIVSFAIYQLGVLIGL